MSLKVRLTSAASKFLSMVDQGLACLASGLYCHNDLVIGDRFMQAFAMLLGEAQQAHHHFQLSREGTPQFDETMGSTRGTATWSAWYDKWLRERGVSFDGDLAKELRAAEASDDHARAWPLHYAQALTDKGVTFVPVDTRSTHVKVSGPRRYSGD